MRRIIKQVTTILFMVLIFEEVSSGQDTSSSAQQLNLDYEVLMDVPKPIPAIFSIFCIDFSYLRWLKAMQLCVYGEHLIVSDLPSDSYYNDAFESTFIFDESVIKKSQRRCKVCKNKMCIVHYRNYYDEQHTLMKGGSFRLCPYCGEKECIMFVN